MESVSPSTPWYQSQSLLIVATILLPPVGLILLWLRRDTETGKKVFGSVAIMALGAVYLFVFFGSGFFVRPNSGVEAHYDELEKQRAAQRVTAARSPVVSEAADEQSPVAATGNATQPNPDPAPGRTPPSNH